MPISEFSIHRGPIRMEKKAKEILEDRLINKNKATFGGLLVLFNRGPKAFCSIRTTAALVIVFQS